MDILLDLKKSVEENAAFYYEKSKKAKGKIPGIQKILVLTKKKLAKVEKERDVILKQLEEQQEQEDKKRLRKKEWYEKFRWFFTSSGYLAIGGRDATSNDIVIKKHVEPGDLIFHTDMSGSPFFVLKKGQEADDQSKTEVATATACLSKAWEKGFASLEVFSATPDQVTKEAQSGEYLGKGAFMIRGKVTYYRPTFELAVGVTEDDKLMCGPVLAVQKKCKKYVVIVQGDKKKSDIAKLLKKELGADLDELIQVLPTGGSKVKKK